MFFKKTLQVIFKNFNKFYQILYVFSKILFKLKSLYRTLKARLVVILRNIFNLKNFSSFKC